MADVIKLLPDKVANQIAAGEVIQRPASVIKELVENAVDAGAKSIKIILRDGGKNLIQVIDDGCGMSVTDARMAFERHATSKITEANDLFGLHTMGFRGEALPSIASVAQIDLYTMRESDSVGTHLRIAASRFEGLEEVACQPGTNISVKNIFFNFPARRKFLKKDSVELNHILHEFERLALVNPTKEFLLVHNDVTLHQLMPGKLKQRIVDLFGKSLDRQLIPVATQTKLVKIEGFISNPGNARKRNPLQFLFVNGRNMRHPSFQHVIEGCYEKLIPADERPNFFMNFVVDPATIDVNIHPTKSEIHFENDGSVQLILEAAVKEALGKFNAVPSIDFDSTDGFEIPAFKPSDSADFSFPTGSGYNPFAKGKSSNAPHASHDDASELKGRESFSASRLNDWDALYDDFKNQQEGADFVPGDLPPIANPATSESATMASAVGESLLNRASSTDGQNIFGGDSETVSSPTVGFIQLRNRYIAIAVEDGIMAIDKRRAHINVLFERFRKQLQTGNVESQLVMFPQSVTLSPSQNATLEEIAGDVKKLGFDVTYLGDSSWVVNAVPASMPVTGNINDVLLKIIEEAAGLRTIGNDMLTAVALSMARTSAVGSSQMLTAVEAETLLGEFLSLQHPKYTPDGLQTCFVIPASDFPNFTS